MNELDLLLGESSQTILLDKAERMKDLSNSVWNNILRKERIIKKNYWHKWIIEGDLKSIYFHSMMKFRRMRKQMFLWKHLEVDLKMRKALKNE